jgi:hypothetical protein
MIYEHHAPGVVIDQREVHGQMLRRGHRADRPEQRRPGIDPLKDFRPINGFPVINRTYGQNAITDHRARIIGMH